MNQAIATDNSSRMDNAIDHVAEGAKRLTAAIDSIEGRLGRLLDPAQSETEQDKRPDSHYLSERIGELGNDVHNAAARIEKLLERLHL